MKKFLKAIRLDASDEHIFRAHGAAADGTWLVSGGFAVCDLANGYRCTPRCHCDDSFLALGSLARCTLAEVVEIDDQQMEANTKRLADHLIDAWGAPDGEAARRAAEDEIAYTAELCETFAPGVWLTVKRTPTANGEGIDEHYRPYDRLLIGAHKL